MSSVSQTGNPFLDSVRLQGKPETPASNNNQQLTQEDFFKLLGQQLSHQDPFKPVENDKMISQMSSFATVDGIKNLNNEITNMNKTMTSSQALQASSLVGRKVLVPSNEGYLAPGSNEVKGVVSAGKSTKEITVRVEDEKGQLVNTFKVDGSAGGNIDVKWDGKDKDGKTMPSGKYTLKATGSVDGESQELPTSTFAHVTSVSLGNAQTGAVLNLKGVGGIKLADVLAVSES
ncbi:flagellar hook assembly protein FlgD [Parashewanella curva]|uniref:Basal-body rod modification protein FlgD n=1 Tax=Parashewanella curva TaxID=2338552 RepID=A0A3L8Q1P5_9GAMM|nr:flagellar hook assembly protein FlgD [Parashewanella curva]RLV61576.1 flagellar hook assembly protein FlgD [Parashewanella curva]